MNNTEVFAPMCAYTHAIAIFLVVFLPYLFNYLLHRALSARKRHRRPAPAGTGYMRARPRT